jgi:hypothetical protein
MIPIPFFFFPSTRRVSDIEIILLAFCAYVTLQQQQQQPDGNTVLGQEWLAKATLFVL